jgi:valyl-tRNA synthetase
MGWPEKTPELEAFYPTSCLVTAFDIIFFWVARMMMGGLHFMGEVPFHEVYIHALVRDSQGQKMSKSKGNVIDPLTVIDTYGTDAFRFTLAAFAAQGRDIKLAEERIAGYRNFANKIWNAARFALMNLEGFDPDSLGFEDLKLAEGDKWVLHRLNGTIRETCRSLEDYRFNEAAMGLYQFTWSEFCDWYVELSKKALYGKDVERKATVRYVLWHVLENLLRLLHPIMPFITEEIWQALPGAKPSPSIMLAPYPEPCHYRDHPEAAANMEKVMAVINAIRNIRGEMEVPPSREIAVILSCGSLESLSLMRHNEGAITSLARVADLAIGRDIEKPEDASIQVAGDVQIFVPLKGVVNVEEEEKRLGKEIARIGKDIDFLATKLGNPSFVERAPAEVVAREQDKLAEFSDKRRLLEESLVKLKRLR